jgi:putative ABC transport system permease protein
MLETDRALLMIREQTALEDLGAFAVREVTFAGGDLPPLRLPAAAVSPEVFRILRTAPLLGRLPDGTGDADAPMVVLAYHLWRTAFGTDREVIGRTVSLDGRPVTVIGVMPEGFAFPFGQDLWMPLELPTDTGVELVGRLGRGASPESAAAELKAILIRSTDTGGRAADNVRVRVLGFTEARAEGGEQIALLALFIIVFALMLLSCTNVSNLLLARSMGRAQELAVHGALGARPWNLVVQMLAESLLIALAGGATGLVLAGVAIRYIEGTLAANWGFYWMRVSLDVTVVLFVGAAMVLTALFSGTLPARQAARSDPGTILAGARVSLERIGQGRIQSTLLRLQVACSLFALIASGFLAAGTLHKRGATLSFAADRIVLAGFTIEGERYRAVEARRDLRAALPRLLSEWTEGVPAALTTGIPGFQSPLGRLEIEGLIPNPDVRPEAVMVAAVSEQAFTILGLSVQRGRTFTAGDGTTVPVAVVSAGFLARHLPDSDPLQTRIRVAGVEGAGDWMQIVGVVPDEVQDMTDGDRLEQIYIPLEQADPTRVFLMLATDQTPAALVPRLRDALRQVDPALPLTPAFLDSPVFRVDEMLAYVDRFFKTTGILALLGSIGGLAVALVGIYGALSFYIRRRTRELGIRIAVGAGRRDILREIICRSWRQMIPGLIAGVIAAWLVSPLFGVFLSGVNPHAPGLYLGTVAIYLLVSLAALLPPALRAAAIDPAHVLREG